MIVIYSATAMLCGFFAELLFGWPLKNWHPVVTIGKLITFMELTLRKLFPQTSRGERTAGIVMAITISLLSLIVPALLLILFYFVHPILGCFIEFLFCWSIFATNALHTAAVDVYHALNLGLAQGRKAVSMIVGRDTDQLTEEGVIKATVETVAENLSDGVLAPMFFILIGGAPLGFFYKGVNTMDSMVGYKNDTYRFYGTGAAKLDDFCNFLPARISGILMIFAAGLGGFNIKNAMRIFVRDRKKHASPNSAQTESVMAGALEVQLGGDACYFGELHKKPTIGDLQRPIERNDILKACQLLYRTCIIAIILTFVVRLAVGLLLI
jgi:adenosylcobinamide-phosphate synthase